MNRTITLSDETLAIISAALTAVTPCGGGSKINTARMAFLSAVETAGFAPETDYSMVSGMVANAVRDGVECLGISGFMRECRVDPVTGDWL